MKRELIALAGLLLALAVMILAGALSGSQTPETHPSVAPRPPTAGR